MEENELVIRLKNGDHDAFEKLYNKYWGQVYNFCRLYMKSMGDTKEIVQQVFVKIWEAKSLMREDDNFKGFLFVITRNLIFNTNKKTFNENFYKFSVLSAFSSEPEYEIEEEIAATQLKEYIYQLIDTLPPRQREVLLLSRDSHMSYKEIATQLGISERTVENHIAKAIKYLKQNLMFFLIFSSCGPAAHL